MLDDRVMAGRDIVATQCRCFAPEIAELDLFVAHHAWIRRSAGLVLAREIIDTESLELIGFVNDLMRNAQRERNGTRISHRLRPPIFVLSAHNAILWPHFRS